MSDVAAARGPREGPPTGAGAERAAPHTHLPLAILQHSSPEYACSLGQHVLSDPVQHSCGHRYCESCVASVSPGTLCPPCLDEDGEEEPLTPEGCVPDPAMRREMARQGVVCVSAGCGWRGQYPGYRAHAGRCEYGEVMCRCGETLTRGRLQQHELHSCALRAVICQFCTSGMNAGDMVRHLDTCTERPVECPLKCGRSMSRKDARGHIDPVQGDCDNRPCPLGCDASGSEHARNAVPVHVEALLQMVKTAEKCVDERIAEENNRNTELNARAGNIEQSMEQVTSHIDAISKKNEKYDQRFTKRTPSRYNIEYSDMAVAAAGPSTASMAVLSHAPSPPDGVQAAAVEASISHEESRLAVINRNIETIIGNHAAAARRAGGERETVGALLVRAAGLERTLAEKDDTVKRQEERIRLLRETSHDGVLTWAITEYSRHRKEAVTRTRPHVTSPPFYTSKAGYKMCLRVYPDGDGIGKASHVSVFFTVMRGEYDAILPWPFRQKVTVMLLDQNNREHVIDAFRPDATSSSFKRPQSDMNIASGLPQFCPLSRLEDKRYGYLKGDTLFMKVIVDNSGL